VDPAYSAISNTLDYTTGSFPVTFADRNLDPQLTAYAPINLTDRLVWKTCEFTILHHPKSKTYSTIADSANKFDGAPVGLQLMGRRLQEERVVAMMEAVVDALQQYSGARSPSI
jgi:amidase